MRKFTLGVIAGNPKDSTSFYRALGPLGNLRTLVPEMTLLMPEEVSWTTLKQIDVLFMQRAFTDDNVRIAEMAKKNKKPLWIDYDDDLTCVSLENPTYFFYQSAAKNIKRLAELADKVTVSTMELGVRLQGEQPKKIVVVPNAVDDDLFHRVTDRVTTNQSICWRDSNTHLKDIAEVTPGITTSLQKYGKPWTMEFWGFCPYFIPDAVVPHVKTFNLHPPTDIVEYHNQFMESKPRIAMIPLSFNKFNEAKSHCGWLECAMAGAVVIAPDWSEWHRKGVLNYKDPKQFGQIMDVAMNLTPKECEDLNMEAWEFIKKHYLLSHINQLRKGVLEQLV